MFLKGTIRLPHDEMLVYHTLILCTSQFVRFPDNIVVCRSWGGKALLKEGVFEPRIDPKFSALVHYVIQKAKGLFFHPGVEK